MQLCHLRGPTITAISHPCSLCWCLLIISAWCTSTWLPLFHHYFFSTIISSLHGVKPVVSFGPFALHSTLWLLIYFRSHMKMASSFLKNIGQMANVFAYPIPRTGQSKLASSSSPILIVVCLNLVTIPLYSTLAVEGKQPKTVNRCVCWH
jgi:hypothetical protein